MLPRNYRSVNFEVYMKFQIQKDDKVTLQLD